MTLLLPDAPTSNVSLRTTCFTTGLLGHVSLDQLRLYSWRLHDGWGLPCDKQNDERPSVHNWESQEDSPCGCQYWTFAEITTVKSRNWRICRNIKLNLTNLAMKWSWKGKWAHGMFQEAVEGKSDKGKSPAGWSFFKTGRHQAAAARVTWRKTKAKIISLDWFCGVRSSGCTLMMFSSYSCLWAQEWHPGNTVLYNVRIELGSDQTMPEPHVAGSITPSLFWRSLTVKR